MGKYVLAIDQGTTGTTVLLIDRQGKICSKINKEFPQHFPQPGWVEHDLEEIWRSLELCMKALKADFKKRGRGSLEKQIHCVGITNQRETIGVWSAKTHKPLAKAIVWQCRRTSAFCQAHKDKEDWIRAKTGLVLDPYFSATKLKWLLENVPAVQRARKSQDLKAGTIDSFLLWRLSGGQLHATDVSNASRSMLMDLQTCQWDPELLDFFNIPIDILPQIRSSSEIYAYTKDLPFLPDGIPISGIAGDQQAALFGQNALQVGEAKCTFGTGSFLLLNTGSQALRSQNGLLSSVGWQLGKKQKPVYVLEGSAFVCGAAVQWLRDQLGIIRRSSDIEALARQVKSSEGVQFVPAFTGLGAPYWNPEARACIVGLTRGSSAAHIARACLEGMAMQNADLLLAMEQDLGKKLRIVKVDGGACENDLLMQMQADFLGTAVLRPRQIESTSLGAAYLAGLGSGFWKSKKDLAKLWQKDRKFQPKITKIQRQHKRQQWLSAVASSQGSASPAVSPLTK